MPDDDIEVKSTNSFATASWKTAALVLIGVTGGGATGSFVGMNTTAPTKQEIVELISTSAPYVSERTEIRSRVTGNEEDIEKLENGVLVLLQGQAEANAKLDILLRDAGLSD